MTLLQYYEQAVKAGELSNNDFQREILTQFQQLADDLIQCKPSWLPFCRKPAPLGIYLYGSVGVGKTHLMDLFFQHAPIQRKSRIHFHHFMQQIDQQLRALQGTADPIQKIAKDLAQSTQLLCLDEFLVFNIADAMILAELLNALFKQGIILVMTSNTKPDDLYKNGAQRVRFLPAIQLIKDHCKVLLLQNERDYRLGREILARRFFSPLGADADQSLNEQFELMMEGQSLSTEDLMVQTRFIPYIKRTERMIWFDFNAICNIPRCHLDYLEIAERFKVVIVSNIPKLGINDTSRVILFIRLVDVLYDCGIILLLSAELPIPQIYPEGPLRQSFQRTISRLEEMQSVDYPNKGACTTP